MSDGRRVTEDQDRDLARLKAFNSMMDALRVTITERTAELAAVTAERDALAAQVQRASDDDGLDADVLEARGAFDEPRVVFALQQEVARLKAELATIKATEPVDYIRQLEMERDMSWQANAILREKLDEARLVARGLFVSGGSRIIARRAAVEHPWLLEEQAAEQQP